MTQGTKNEETEAKLHANIDLAILCCQKQALRGAIACLLDIARFKDLQDLLMEEYGNVVKDLAPYFGEEPEKT